MKIRRRHPMSSREVRSMRNSLMCVLSDPQLDTILSVPVERASSDSYDIILSKGEPVVFTPNGNVFPTLRGFLRVKIHKRYVKVDSGAVPYVANGADIMSPGVVAIDSTLKEGDLCVVTEERHDKPICVAKMVVDASEVDRSKRGKVAKNIHFVGDALWKIDTS